ncbi:Gfo/Idh/MocA family oxidoreductase [Paraburkholderia sediminicola]|uniref:Gfo/Idh/MocA family oxidoreductase n=1 Tax=Paraburkholderia sediminicola TaxID=458836 RepID=UPI0038BBF58F
MKMTDTDAERPIRIGIVGFGTAGRAFVPAIAAHPGFELTAIVDPAHAVRRAAVDEFHFDAYDTLEALLEHAEVDAIYVASPTTLHREHVLLACAARKHVLVEKPMAANLADAKAMVSTAKAAGVVLLVGHSHSYDLPIHAMRELIDAGELGRVRMVNTWCFTDWLYRPRRADELDTRQGGGVTLRQGSHQFDIIRLLCGGAARCVRAKTFDWDPQRSAIGAHTVFIDFADGAAATAIYNGYGRFSSTELCEGVGEWGFMNAGRPAADRSASAAGKQVGTPEEELLAKQARAKHAIPGDAPWQPFFGLTIVSCERGEIRQSPQGLIVYTDSGRSDLQLPTGGSPRSRVMAEFHDAISGRRAALHDGAWGLANLEVCEAAIASSASGRDVELKHQVPLNRSVSV